MPLWSITTYVVVAEWLRRLTRNQMGFTRTGSNPVHDENFFPIFYPAYIQLQRYAILRRKILDIHFLQTVR